MCSLSAAPAMLPSSSTAMNKRSEVGSSLMAPRIPAIAFRDGSLAKD
jgi:hypothetical protein